ncbi:MAG: hypothetical protein K2Y37_13850 [Pirellulales bacterium]|nr:hypothetical protein [Pirellulales bacterium]
MRHTRLEHRFVKHAPDLLEPGILYISMEYCTVTHSCCCGCGEEVVTPLGPTDWKLTFDGETISLWPSVGNWTLKCRSHYIIDHGRVLKAPPLTKRQIAAEQRRNGSAKASHYNPDKVPDRIEAVSDAAASLGTSSQSGALNRWSKVKEWIRKRWRR